MAEDSDPPRKVYGFKPTEYERVNDVPRAPVEPHAATPSPPPSAAAPGPIDVRTLAREAYVPPPSKAATRLPPAPENEVQAVLRENLARANAAGLNEVSSRPRRSRRRRDYFLALVIGNTVLLGGAFLMPIFGIAGMILFNVGITWIMWFVMDDY